MKKFKTNILYLLIVFNSILQSFCIIIDILNDSKSIINITNILNEHEDEKKIELHFIESYYNFRNLNEINLPISQNQIISFSGINETILDYGKANRTSFNIFFRKDSPSYSNANVIFKNFLFTNRIARNFTDKSGAINIFVNKNNRINIDIENCRFEGM